MATNLFSTYRQGENRVTSTLMAVLQRLSLPNIDGILQALLDRDDFNLATFENQPSLTRGTRKRPDAKIERGSNIWIETKTTQGQTDIGQVKQYLEVIGPSETLLLLTPDNEKPKDLPQQVVWTNFLSLAGAIKDILDHEDSPPFEMEAFLLREFLSMLREDGLLISSADKVMVVSARIAWPIYKEFNVYTHAPYKRFHPANHIAFYTNMRIQEFVPRVISTIESIHILKQKEIDLLNGEQKELAQALHEKITRRGFEGHSEFATPHKFIFLTGPENDETVKLPAPIVCDKISKNGRAVPLMYGGQRYVTVESVQNARLTSKLEFC